jgi:D-alanyl-D-alanine carboxypeptidase
MSASVQTAQDHIRHRLGAAPFSAAIVCNGVPQFHCHTPPEPLLPIYSLTKTYIAVLVLQTIARGRLGLETPVAPFYPDVPAAERVTVHHLLSHTSGLPDYGHLDAYVRAVAGGGPAWSFDEFADHTYRRGAAFAPGSGWGYSNTGYALLVGTLEQVWQRSFDELLHDLITAPLDLRRTRPAASLDDPDVCPASSSALGSDGLLRPVKAHYAPGWVWHRLIVSDALDSARFLDAILGQRWLGGTLTEAMTALHPVGGRHPPWTKPAYGLGLMGEPDGAHGPVSGHNGGGPGYATSAYFFARSRRAIAVVAATEAADRVLDTVFALNGMPAP